MPIKLKSRLDLDINEKFLLCTLYTLSESQKIFKNLNLTTDLYLDNNNYSTFSINIKNLHEVCNLLNKTSLRTFSYILINPLLKLKNLAVVSSSKNIFKDKEVYNDKILLKKYLIRFKYNYYRYFCSQNENWKDLPTDKELNLSAIILLFLITGL